MRRIALAGMASALTLALAACSQNGTDAAAAPVAAAPAASSYAEDRALIEDLQARYMFALDWREPEAYAATFAPDGSMDSAAVTGKGREAIAQEIVAMKAREAERYAQDKSGKPPPRMRHNITNIVLDIRGDRAYGKAYWTSLTNGNPERKPQVNGYGHYEDELVKIDGQWYFTSRKIYNEFAPGREGPEKINWPPASATPPATPASPT
jgi:hypothetical protein